MNERKILLFSLSVVAYFMYSVHMWFTKVNSGLNAAEIPQPLGEIHLETVAVEKSEQIKEDEHKSGINEDVGKTEQIKQDMRRSDQIENSERGPESRKKTLEKVKKIQLHSQNTCNLLQTFTEKPLIQRKRMKRFDDRDSSSNTIAVIGMTVFLIVLTINAIMDVVKVREQEQQKRRLNPDGIRRQSLAEFANKKTLRRESSKTHQLFQIAESLAIKEEEEANRRQTRPYQRGDSTNSYLSDVSRKSQGEGSAPASINESSSAEPRLVKRQSIAKLIGARPAPMVRRSSFPALPQNPEVQALMLGHRQQSVDSDDEDGKGRRVRIIRRY